MRCVIFEGQQKFVRLAIHAKDQIKEKYIIKLN